MSEGKFPEIITLCGSTRFKEKFEEANKRLTLENKIVISVGVFGYSDKTPLSKKEKERLDLIHKRKIDISDSIMIIDEEGYIGESTQGEIEYATKENKKIYYYSKYFKNEEEILNVTMG